MSAKKRSTKKASKKSSAKKKPAPSAKVKAKAKKATRTKAKPAKARAKGKRAANKTAAGVTRRDHAGHLDPKYAKELRALGGEPQDDHRAFLRHSRSKDDLAEELGEEFVAEATSGEHEGEELNDQNVPEEIGGPFVVTDADTEFARGTDASNPRGAKREPFPRT